MRIRSRIPAVLALAGCVSLGGVALPGCTDDRTKTGTLVEMTPEQKASEKAAMEGMKKAMEGMKKARR